MQALLRYRLTDIDIDIDPIDLQESPYDGENSDRKIPTGIETDVPPYARHARGIYHTYVTLDKSKIRPHLRTI